MAKTQPAQKVRVHRLSPTRRLDWGRDGYTRQGPVLCYVHVISGRSLRGYLIWSPSLSAILTRLYTIQHKHPRFHLFDVRRGWKNPNRLT